MKVNLSDVIEAIEFENDMLNHYYNKKTGVIIYKETPGTGPIVGAAMVSETDNLLLSGKNAICIAANEVPLLGRTATGNIMIKKGEIGSIIKL